MNINTVNPHQSEVRRMIAKADALMQAQYPAESNHLDDVNELAKPNVYFIGAFVDNRLVGIGAVKLLSDDGEYGEIKRVYVEPDFRGLGISVEIMSMLEAHLSARGVSCARLETGDKQSEAVSLYRKLGYHARPPYGSYTEDPLSLFMEKRLG